MRFFKTIIIAALGHISPVSAEIIRVYNWAEYIDLDLLVEFTELTGIEVIYETYNNSEAVETMLSAGNSGYDVVVVSSEYFERLRNADALSKIDHSKLATFGSMWTDVMELAGAIDPGSTYSIPYLWGTTGLGYDTTKVLEIMPDAPLDSWALLFEPSIVSQFTGCGVVLTDAIEELISIALVYLGYDPNSHDPDQILQAEYLIRDIMPYVTEVGTEQYDVMVKGDACVAMVWSGEALLAQDKAIDGVDIGYTVPLEGAPLWFDLMIIPADSQNENAAHVFIDFIQRPENIARISNFAYYPNGNAASIAYVDEELLSNPDIFPTEETMLRLYPVHSRPPLEKRAISRAWRRMQLTF